MTRFNPLVSIVVPVYNGANYMREAIDSALAQTYKNVEIIVVDDGSRDDGETARIAQLYGDRIRYFSKMNGGCASALNLGISKMRGEYFSWLSHDDVYLPEKIEHQVRILSNLPDKDTILYGGWEIIDSASKPVTTVRPEAAQPVEKLNKSLFPLLRGLLHGCSMLIPVRYFRDIGVFNEELPSTQDYDLWFRFLRVAPIYYDSRVLIRSRVHPEQGTYKITKHVEEVNTLWCGFLENLTNAEMAEMEGTPHNFYMQTAAFLANTPYRGAHDRALFMAEECLHRTLVSVVIPFHNRIDWTLAAIRSVLDQTHRALEIILVDDGSTDDVASIINIAHSDSRIRYTKQRKAGPAKARNTGIALASGEYIAFLDSDDLFCPEKVAKQLRYMAENEIKISHTSFNRMDLQGQDLGVENAGRFSGWVFPDIINYCPIAMPTVMGRASIFKSYPFPEEFEVGEDVCLWIKLASQYPLGGIDHPLSKIRVGAETASMNTAKQIIGRLNIAAYLARDPFLGLFGKQLRKFLLHTLPLVPDTTGPKVDNSWSIRNYGGKHTLLAKAIRYARQHGLAAAFRRARLFRFR